MSKTNKQKELIRGELKSRKRMYKAKKNWVVAGATIALGISALGFTSNVQAETWQATSIEEMQQKVKAEDGQYTFEQGDTFWVIGNAINIKTEKLMEMNGYAQGTQYSVPVGTTIYWDGNHVTVKDAEGNVVADKVVQDTDKIDPNKTVAGQATDIPKNPVVADTNGNVTTSQKNNGQSTNSKNSNNKPNNNNTGQNNQSKPAQKPVTPSKPVTPENPVKPTDPEKPEVKKYAVTVIYKDTDGNILGKDSDVFVEENQSFTATAKSFDGFTLVGNATQTVKVTADTTITFTYSKNTVTPPTPVEKFDVTTNFVDEDGNVIADKVVSEVEKGTEFTTTAKNIDGYTVKGEATQTVTVDGDKEVTFTYSKNAVTPPEVQKFDVTVNFVDESGNEIADKDVVLVEEGQEYTATAKTINGFTLVGTPTQTVTVDGAKTLTFTYKKDEVTPPVAEKFNVTVTYKDTDGNVLATDSPVSVEEGKSFTATAKVIDNYTLQGSTTQTITVTGNTTLTFTYVKNAVAPVVVDKSELQTLVNNVQGTEKGNYTNESFGEFETNLNVAKDVLADSQATQAEVDSAKANLQRALDKLEENAPAVQEFTVTTNYVTTDGTVLNTVTNTVKEGESFTATAQTFDGYTLQGNATQTVTVNGDTTLTFTYKADEVTPPIQDVSTVEAQIASQALVLINQHRASNGLTALNNQTALQSGASVRSEEIFTSYEHTRPNGEDGMDAPYDYGYDQVVFCENIGMYNNPSSLEWLAENGASLVVNAWINSSGHNANLLLNGINEGSVGITLKDNGSGKYTMGSAFLGAKNYDATTKSRSVETTQPSESQAVSVQSATIEETPVTEETTETSVVEEATTETEEVAPTVEEVLPVNPLAVGNFDKLFTTKEEAEQKAMEQVKLEGGEWFNYTFKVTEVEMSDGTVQYGVDFTATTIDKSELAQAYNIALGIDEQNYDTHTWSTLAIKIGNAKNVFDDANASQVQVDKATNNLINTINNM